MAEITLRGYTRYVALGDSQTEGLWDGDESAGIVGFADRLAVMLDALHPGLQYANLAVRGRRIRDVLDDQLPRALAMRPDLITVCIGMNDVTRPGRSSTARSPTWTCCTTGSPRRARQSSPRRSPTWRASCRSAGPGARVLQDERGDRDGGATGYGFRLVDLYGAPSMTEPDTWSDDRVHGSTKGHMLFAAAAAEALNLPGSNHDWAQAGPAVAAPGLRSRMYSQALWTQNLLMPWLWRHFPGLSSGDGRGPKRPSSWTRALVRLRSRVGRAESATARCRSRPPRRGQKTEMASPVNIVAGPSDMPAASATCAAASAGVWPRLRQHRAHRLTECHRVGGVGRRPMPALLSALMNASSVGSACGGRRQRQRRRSTAAPR